MYNGKLMNKLLLGLLLLGLVGAGGYFGYTYLQPSSPPSYGAPVSTTPVSFTLSVTSPENNALVFDPTILVQGKTSPNSTVIISNQNDLPLTANQNGDFSTTIKLQAGINQLTIGAVDEMGNTKSETRTVYYTKTKL